MKKYILTIVFLLAAELIIKAQTADPLVSKCVMNAGENTRYLKDFRVQLAKGSPSEELRYKTQMSLWKNTKYRFSMCNSEDSKGELILTIKDNTNKVVLSSYDQKSGKIYPFIDFICNKSGIYQLNFDFSEAEQGSGVGVVSMVR
ncbi:MAG: hypothetical protein JXN62_09190 [Bacteroidales bacterium]|nr:hypothetical protein [Bacteroidales bacterium]